jgi:hypothetical protein
MIMIKMMRVPKIQVVTVTVKVAKAVPRIKAIPILLL